MNEMIPLRITACVCVAIFLIVAATDQSCGDAPDQPSTPKKKSVDFARDVYPILQRSCLECHGEQKQEGDLRLDVRDQALQSGTIEVDSPADSELLRRILLPRGDDEVMPAIGDPLTRQQISIIRRWIQQGAPWPDDFKANKHWSYIAPVRPQPPAVSASQWAKSPVDQFVLRRLVDEGLSPSPRATPQTLVRRVYLDLIGLPPTPEEVNHLLTNPSEDRFETLVNELLARPQFGERWARPWLDLAHYADSHGFQKDNLREHWAYRDWVIRALNDDMPFDQFTIEQIAGDLLPDATESQKIATGFHRCTPTNVEAGSLPEETRIEQVMDRVNTTGAVWLGTTLECCQCHDHKYDPFSQKEYYQLLAFYNNTQLEADLASPNKPSSIQFNGPTMPLSNPQRDAQHADLQKQLAEANQQLRDLRKELESDLQSWVTELAERSAKAPKTHVLDITSFQSEGATDTFEKLEDGSILLVGGDPPDTDVYTVRVRGQLTDIRKFQLDALQHHSLPGEGPGRGDPKRRNFVLNGFAAELRPLDASPATKLEFSSATASFSQTSWDVSGALQNKPKTGWAIAPQFDRSHWATFTLAKPLDIANDAELVFTLTQEFGKARTIGRFQLSAVTGAGEGISIPDDLLKVAAKPIAEWSKRDRSRVLDYRVKQDTRSSKLARDITKLKKQIQAVVPDTTLVMVELEKPRMSTVFERGDYQKPGEVVQPGTPSILHSMPESPRNRLDLARWLVSPQNPLVARVTVNRLWAELFGQGIVTTVEDFGVKGEPPSHPELLDWLAVEFVEKGWSTKQLLKTIVMSATYQQSSHLSEELLEKDDRNQLLARGPRFRMDAEMIRDNALAISGLLSLKQYGPPIRPFQPDGIWIKTGGTAYQYEVSPGSEQYRRGIYVVLKRGSPYPSFVNFDATARLVCTVKRSRTNTPLQALTLLNDPVYVEAAKSLADRVLTEKKGEPLDSQLDFAFQLCTARKPTEAERHVLADLYRSQLEEHADQFPKSSRGQTESDAWRSVAAVLLNLHETITKN
ncbi:PSD1 and planctomycete cytochrome C domain-containing protein [Novipirellula rosea]|uniref:PSD1 and planctomycete cytochrome C domain-containing protein n=2 Tax=Novipirellula rosea TaxID=1031540 RepID=A0ABP8M8D2_9BACT